MFWAVERRGRGARALETDDSRAFLAQIDSAQTVHAKVRWALKNLGFETLTEIQAAAVPAAAENSDVVIAAETGSGKTLSYLIPILFFIRAGIHLFWYETEGTDNVSNRRDDALGTDQDEDERMAQAQNNKRVLQWVQEAEKKESSTDSAPQVAIEMEDYSVDPGESVPAMEINPAFGAAADDDDGGGVASSLPSPKRSTEEDEEVSSLATPRTKRRVRKKKKKPATSIEAVADHHDDLGGGSTDAQHVVRL